MRIMAYVFVFGLVACLFGCTSGSNMVSSGLEGSYAGTYRIVDGAYLEEGTLTMVIGKDGRTSGAATNASTAEVSTLSGTVNKDKAFWGSLQGPEASFSLSGQLTLTAGNRLVGVLRRNTDTGASAGTFTVDCLPEE